MSVSHSRVVLLICGLLVGAASGTQPKDWLQRSNECFSSCKYVSWCLQRVGKEGEGKLASTQGCGKRIYVF